MKSTFKITHNIKHDKFRGSRYTGVSVNGKGFQVLAMIDKQKIYLCQTKDSLLAAKLYDLANIQCKGLSAKTNFNYTTGELLAAFFEKSIIKVRTDYL